jgi:RNA polymerase sigma-70 factor (subfamily 1)
VSEWPDDEDLVRQAQAGDESALTVLMQRYQALLTHHAERQLPDSLRPRVSTADVVQEAQIVAYERHREFEDRGGGSFRNWLLKIVDLKVKEVLRTHMATAKRAQGREVVKRTNVRTAYFVSGNPSPSQVAVGDEVQEIARRAMNTLPEDYRQVLRLAREQGLSLREAAACMGRSREATKKLYGRALSRFTEEFQRRGGMTHG